MFDTDSGLHVYYVAFGLICEHLAYVALLRLYLTNAGTLVLS